MTECVVGGQVLLGDFSPSGLRTAGLVTIQSINQTTWTALPATALSGRNAISIQNRSGQQMVINYDATVVGYVGVIIDDGGERFYDVTDNIPIYGKSKTSTVTVIVEELS